MTTIRADYGYTIGYRQGPGVALRGDNPGHTCLIVDDPDGVLEVQSHLLDPEKFTIQARVSGGTFARLFTPDELAVKRLAAEQTAREAHEAAIKAAVVAPPPSPAEMKKAEAEAEKAEKDAEKAEKAKAKGEKAAAVAPLGGIARIALRKGPANPEAMDVIVVGAVFQDAGVFDITEHARF